MRVVTLAYPSQPYTPGESPCPDCGRYGGTPHLVHAGEAPDGTLDLSLAGLRCTAEALWRMVDAHEGGDDLSDEALPLADYLRQALVLLDTRAGGVA